MGLICELPKVIWEAKKEYEELKSKAFTLKEQYGSSDNILALGDNAAFMKHLH